MFVTSVQMPSSGLCLGGGGGEDGKPARPPFPTIGRSRTERAERRAARRRDLSALDLQRELLADRLKCPLVFLAPLVLMILLLLILFGVYILRPFHKALDFTAGKCMVVRVQWGPEGSCNSQTDLFSPCVQIEVMVQLSDGSRGRALIMENEQALVNCQQCSFTFGHHGLLADRLAECGGWRDDFNRLACVTNYLHQHGQLTLGMAVNSILWPLLGLLGYAAASGFILFDCRKRRKLNAQLESQASRAEWERMPGAIGHRRSRIACRHGNQHISHFSNYPLVLNGSLSCTCLDHVLEDHQTLSRRAEALWSHPSPAIPWTEQDLLNLEHMDLAIPDYPQQRPRSAYCNVHGPQEGEEFVDSETEWGALRGDMDFGITEQEIDHYFSCISRRQNFRQSILPFRPFTVMNETKV
ncbi:uncharacterized protein LOC144601668 isoform X2 [Rhinoraja longicauda]